MKVWVVMGNDFPDSVWSSEHAAESYCIEKKAERRDVGPRIHWRVYEFEVKK